MTNGRRRRTSSTTIEQNLTEFRIRNAGQLPDQWGVNVQQSSALEARASSLSATIGRLNQDKLVGESEIRVLQQQIDSITKSPAGGGGGGGGPYVDQRLQMYEDRIHNAEQQLAAVLDRYTPNHPDVKRFESQIELLKQDRDAYVASRATERDDDVNPEGPMLTAQQVAEVRRLNAQIQDKQIQLRSKDLEVERTNEQIDAVNQRIQALQERLQRAPVGEQEYTTLMRDHELKKRRYDDLNLKMSQSEIATDLENRKQGETLELLDPASLPSRPEQPIRWVIIMVGAMAGIGMGGVLVFLREMKDTSLQTLKDVRAYTQLTILGSIPLLENDLVVMRRRRMSWLAWTTACLFAAVAMAGSIYYYYATKV